MQTVWTEKKRQAWSESILFDTLMVFLKEIFEKADFEKNQQKTKRMKNYPVDNELKYIFATDTITRLGPRRDKTCLRGFRQSEIQTSLLSYRD